MKVDSEELMPIEEFSKIKGIDEKKVVDMIRDGFYSGRIIENKWYVYRTELPKEHHPSIEKTNIEEGSYPVFSRKQLAWMGLFIGVVVIILLNIQFDYRSTIEQIANNMFSYREEKSAIWGINIALVIGTWLGRIQLGILFAFIVGIFLNVASLFIKKV